MYLNTDIGVASIFTNGILCVAILGVARVYCNTYTSVGNRWTKRCKVATEVKQRMYPLVHITYTYWIILFNINFRTWLNRSKYGSVFSQHNNIPCIRYLTTTHGNRTIWNYECIAWRKDSILIIRITISYMKIIFTIHGLQSCYKIW
jgi:hypothetical protein